MSSWSSGINSMAGTVLAKLFFRNIRELKGRGGEGQGRRREVRTQHSILCPCTLHKRKSCALRNVHTMHSVRAA